MELFTMAGEESSGRVFERNVSGNKNIYEIE